MRRNDPLAQPPPEPPAGNRWDFLTAVPVRREDRYAYVAATLADSSLAGGQAYTTFMVSSLTNDGGVFYDSAPDSGYSVDNLSPVIPEGLFVDYTSEENILNWAPAVDEDFSHGASSSSDARDYK